MNLSEIAQKNRRVIFWKEILSENSLPEEQKSEFTTMIKSYQRLLISIISHSDQQGGLVSDVDALNLTDLERKLEQLAETSRLEAGKSVLL
jgi:hypothetical protein